MSELQQDNNLILKLMINRCQEDEEEIRIQQNSRRILKILGIIISMGNEISTTFFELRGLLKTEPMASLKSIKKIF